MKYIMTECHLVCDSINNNSNNNSSSNDIYSAKVQCNSIIINKIIQFVTRSLKCNVHCNV